MSESDSVIDALDRMATERPTTTGELADTLAVLTKIASRWSDALEALREPTRRLVGPAAAASLEVAMRRAEESFVELEITLGDVSAARQPRRMP